MTTAQLDRLMRSVLANLELTSGSKAGQMAQGSKDSDQRRAGPPYVPDVVGYWRRRYDDCETDQERYHCIDLALNELRQMRYSQGKTDARLRDDRMKVGTEDAPVRIVAYRFGCSERHVHRCRAEAKAAKLPVPDYRRRAA